MTSLRHLRAALGVYKTIQRQREARAARALHQLRQRLLDQQDDALGAAILSISQDEHSVRRTVERALGKWRGSTLSGYLRGDETTYRSTFHCSKDQFDGLVDLLGGSCLDKAEKRAGFVAGRGHKVVRQANAHLDRPTLRFKIAASLYALVQEGSIKVKADVASVGAQTLRDWLTAFADAVRTFLKPIFMSGKPFSTIECEAVRSQFASRRGIKVATLACDGSHIPFHPKNRAVALDYRNYKGWKSILAVAFVDSYYRFFELDVGYPGRAGDNTVLAQSSLMQAIKSDPDKWLGPGGVVLGDSGASDGDSVFLNPYHNPSEEEKCWFNFCHSSTRFFVEQTFGMWKSRFRFLLCYMRGANHTLTTKLIYASAILHNYFVVHSGDKVDVDTTAPCWTRFFESFKVMSCPECKRAGIAHCVHQATYRNGAAQTVHARKAPSALRDSICEELWQASYGDATLVGARDVMRARALAGFEESDE